MTNSGNSPISLAGQVQSDRDSIANSHELSASLSLCVENLGLWAWDVETGVVNWSKDLFRMFQLPPEDSPPMLAGQDKLFPPADYARLRRAVRSTLRNGRSYTLEVNYIPMDGVQRRALSKSHAHHNKQGRVTRLFGCFVDITHIQQLEARLKDSESQLKLTQEENSTGAWSYDVINDTWRISKMFAEILGIGEADYTREQAINLAIPEDRAKLNKAITSHLETGAPLKVEQRSINQRTGELMWISIHGEMIFDALGRATQSVGIARDITALNTAQVALNDSEARFSQFMDSVPALAYIKDKDHVFRYSNRTLKGYSASSTLVLDHLEGKNTHDIFPAATAPAIDQVEDEILRTGKPIRQEIPLLMKNGESLWMDGVKFPIQLGHEKFIGGFFIDVTKRRLADQQKERFLSAIEQSSDMITITDTQGRIEYLNPISESITGRPRSELIGQLPNVFESEFYDDDFFQEVLKTLLAGNSWQGNIKTRGEDGSTLLVKTTASPVRDSSGEITSFVVVSSDITRQQELEQILLQSQKMESIGTLAGGVAHDYNNVLQTIIGNSELLLEDPNLTPQLVNLVEEIKTAADNSARLTSQLLTFARKQKIEPNPISINDQISGILPMLQRLIGANIELNWKPESSLWNVNMDTAQWNQVVTNLCINARDAIEDVGNITISTSNLLITAEAQPEGIPPGEYVHLEVRDNGCGIEEGAVERIFEPFFTTKAFNGGTGTGLGLSTVYGIIKQNRGFIDVKSRPGEGTSFHVFVPRAFGNPASPKPAVEAAPAEKQTATILVVEDDHSILRLVERSLSKRGFKVLKTEDPEIALELVEAHADAINLILTDIIMPSMNGKELAARVRSTHPNIKFIFMSGYTADILKDGTESAADHFIHKPFKIEQLTSTIQEALNR